MSLLLWPLASIAAVRPSCRRRLLYPAAASAAASRSCFQPLFRFLYVVDTITGRFFPACGSCPYTQRLSPLSTSNTILHPCHRLSCLPPTAMCVSDRRFCCLLPVLLPLVYCIAAPAVLSPHTVPVATGSLHASMSIEYSVDRIECFDTQEVVTVVPTVQQQSLPTSAHGNSTVKQKKFTFCKTFKLILLQAVQQHDAHRAPHGKMDERYRQVLQTFLNNLSERIWSNVQKPQIKTPRDKVRSMIADRRSTNTS